MRVGELAERLGVRYRDVRYVLERGIMPAGVDESPGRGEHRDLSAAQAFWLAIVLHLKANGVRTPLAGQIAEFARAALRSVSENLPWDRPFDPFRGMMSTDWEWFVECGDLKFVRGSTNAVPTIGGRLGPDPWHSIKTKRVVSDAAPVVIIRVDLGQLARRLL